MEATSTGRAIRLGHPASRMVLGVWWNAWEVLLGGSLRRLSVSVAGLCRQWQHRAVHAKSRPATMWGIDQPYRGSLSTHWASVINPLCAGQLRVSLLALTALTASVSVSVTCCCAAAAGDLSVGSGSFLQS